MSEANATDLTHGLCPIRYNNYNMKKGPADIFIVTVIAYIFLGTAVVAVQELSGSKCGPVTLGGDYVYEVNQDVSRFWIWRIFEWLPNAFDNLVEKDVSFGEFMSPRKCIFESDGTLKKTDDEDI